MSATTSQTLTQAPEARFALAAPSPAPKGDWQSLASGDRSGNLKLRGIPTFSDPLAKRQWMKEHMAAAFRFFAKQGYAEGVSGHISMRGMTKPPPSPGSRHSLYRRPVQYGRLG